MGSSRAAQPLAPELTAPGSSARGPPAPNQEGKIMKARVILYRAAAAVAAAAAVLQPGDPESGPS